MAEPVVCVVGASTAGLEGLLAARERLGATAELRLIAPDQEFRYRPTSRDSLFRPARERSLAIATLVAETGATWSRDRADVIDEAERTVLTRDGDTIAFDYLLLAPGAHRRRALAQGFVWERGGDPGFLDQIISDVVAGRVHSVAVVVPRGARWPLPAYELALILAWTAAGTSARITLLSAERQVLGALGQQATETVTLELEAAGVEVITGVEVLDEQPAPGTRAGRPDSADRGLGGCRRGLTSRPTDPARVRLGRHSPAEFDRLISLPTVVGPFIAGVATDAAGFIEVDETLRVCGSERVWAAGGCVAAALEHSALAAQQADAAIAAIAALVSPGGHGADDDHPGRTRADRPAAHRAARAVAGREPRGHAGALYALSVVATRARRGQHAGQAHRRLGPHDSGGAARSSERPGDPRPGGPGLQRTAQLHHAGPGHRGDARGTPTRHRESPADGRPAPRA